MSAYSVVLSQVQKRLQDNAFESGGANEDDERAPIAQQIQLDICSKVVIPRHRTTGTVTTTTSDYIYDLPSNWFREHPRWTTVDVTSYGQLIKKELSYLDTLDPDHTDTTTAGQPSYYAIEGSQIFIYPKWAGTLNIRNYIRQPVLVTGSTDSIDIISESISGDTLSVDAMTNGILWKIYSEYLDEPELAEIHLAKYNDILNEMKKRLHVRDFNRAVSAT